MNLVKFISSKRDRKIVWQDIRGKKYTLGEIKNSYLLNILNFIYSGGGGYPYIAPNNIELLYQEALQRGLKPKHGLSATITHSNFLKPF